MSEKTTIPSGAVTGGSVTDRIDLAIRKHVGTDRGFFVVMLQVVGLEAFRKRRPDHVVNGLVRELFAAVRNAVHPSQYVGVCPEGLLLVFDSLDVGQVDTISRRLSQLAQQVIRAGHYNDLTNRWTDILFQFLSPGTPSLLMTKVGWAIYPRDGSTAVELMNRTRLHIAELSR